LPITGAGGKIRVGALPGIKRSKALP